LCHRQCNHCYDTRFRPYVREERDAVVNEALASHAAIIANLPDWMTYRETPDGPELPGRVILSGGEVLLDPIREPVLYPVMDMLRAKYADQGGVRVVVQTTGDLVTPEILDELIDHGVWEVSITGMDDFHVGHEGDKRLPLVEKLTAMFKAAGLEPTGRRHDGTDGRGSLTPVYSMMGANPEEWIGAIWPRGRAWDNELSSATLDDNFCNRWSGGLNFMEHGKLGSEVSIEPNGNVYPCCLKTKSPLGNLTEEKLVDILDSMRGHPAFEALNAGAPEKMGTAFGWDEATFLEHSETVTPSGETYRNLCIGCDRFHEQVLGPLLDGLRETRLAAKKRHAA
jgi:sulfatase maturation enzyme AslB (radical SAM superfamily)